MIDVQAIEPQSHRFFAGRPAQRAAVQWFAVGAVEDTYRNMGSIGGFRMLLAPANNDEAE
jgi:hypothetical protein